MYDMVQYIETDTESDFSHEMKDFLNVVPDALDFERWLLNRQEMWPGNYFWLSCGCSAGKAKRAQFTQS